MDHQTMADTTRNHRVTQFAIIGGFVPPEGSVAPPGLQHDRLSFSLTEGRTRIKASRLTADHFHTWECTDRNGTPLHIAYARHLPHSSKQAHRGGAAGLDITYIYEVTGSAVAASFGFHPLTPQRARDEGA
jgi:hypothetical protein